MKIFFSGGILAETPHFYPHQNPPKNGPKFSKSEETTRQKNPPKFSLGR